MNKYLYALLIPTAFWTITFLVCWQPRVFVYGGSLVFITALLSYIGYELGKDL